jgi:hypothetical protein
MSDAWPTPQRPQTNSHPYCHYCMLEAIHQGPLSATHTKLRTTTGGDSIRTSLFKKSHKKSTIIIPKTWVRFDLIQHVPRQRK